MLRFLLIAVVTIGLAACSQDGGDSRVKACKAALAKSGSAAAPRAVGAERDVSADASATSQAGTFAYQPIQIEPAEPAAPTEPAEPMPRGLEAAPIRATVTVHGANRLFREKLTAIFADDTAEKNVVVLSAGGEMGAFGAGFLNGLASKSGSPMVPDVVTAVSAGSLLAVPVFLGRKQDYETLRREFTTITDDDLITRRRPWRLPFSNSIYRTKKLRKRVDAIITPEMVEALARAATDENRRVGVLAVDIYAGLPRIFDLTAIAAGEAPYSDLSPEEKRGKIVSAIVASAAIEVVFEPVFIDDVMYGDGGARQYVFLGADFAVSADSGRDLVQSPAANLESYDVTLSSTRERPVNVYVVVNEDFQIAPECTKNSLLGIAKRTSSIFVDQILWSSVYELLSTSRQMGWQTHIVDARMVMAQSEDESDKCSHTEGSDAFFDRPFMRCLYEKACLAAANTDNPWQEGLSALPPPPLSRAVTHAAPDQCKPWPLSEKNK